jgi:hypothetical protein
MRLFYQQSFAVFLQYIQLCGGRMRSSTGRILWALLIPIARMGLFPRAAIIARSRSSWGPARTSAR